jgi:hypothetical protein
MADSKSRSDRARSDVGKTPLQRLLTGGGGIPMPSRELDVSEDLALFTPEERRELRRAASEQCEANR